MSPMDRLGDRSFTRSNGHASWSVTIGGGICTNTSFMADRGEVWCIVGDRECTMMNGIGVRGGCCWRTSAVVETYRAIVDDNGERCGGLLKIAQCVVGDRRAINAFVEQPNAIVGCRMVGRITMGVHNESELENDCQMCCWRLQTRLKTTAERSGAIVRWWMQSWSSRTQS